MPIMRAQDYLQLSDYPRLAVYQIEHHLRIGFAGAIMFVGPMQVRGTGSTWSNPCVLSPAAAPAVRISAPTM